MILYRYIFLCEMETHSEGRKATGFYFSVLDPQSNEGGR